MDESGLELEDSKLKETQTEQKSGRRQRRKLKATNHFEENMMLLPHIEQAFNLEKQAQEDAKKNPLAGKLNLNIKPVEQKKPTPQNVNTTGISIANGNYLNTSQKVDSLSQPTWKALAGNSSFYSQCFDMNDPRGPSPKKRYEPDGPNNNNYRPAFDLPGQKRNGDQKSSRQIDDAFRRMGDPNNLNQSTRDRLQRLMDSAGGADLDPEKVARHFRKQQWNEPEGPPGYDYSKGNGNAKNYSNDDRDAVGGFKSGLTMFQ